jgi:hypothetical protein
VALDGVRGPSCGSDGGTLAKLRDELFHPPAACREPWARPVDAGFENGHGLRWVVTVDGKHVEKRIPPGGDAIASGRGAAAAAPVVIRLGVPV